MSRHPEDIPLPINSFYGRKRGLEGTMYLTGAYIAVTLFSIMVNKLLYTYSEYKFPFPFFTAFIQIVFSLLFMFIWSYIHPTYLKNRIAVLRIPPFQWDSSTAIQVAPLTLVYMCLLIFSPLFFQRVEVTSYHFSNSITIAFSMVFSYVVLKVKTSSTIGTAATLIIFGLFLSTVGYFNLSIESAFYVLAWPAVVSIYAVYIKKTLVLMRNNIWPLIQYNTLMISIILIPFLLLSGELSNISSKVWFWDEIGFWIQMILTSLTGFMTTIMMVTLIMYTSPLTFSVVSVVKTVIQTLLVALIFGNRLSLVNISGMVIALGGASYYGYLRVRDSHLRQ